jgi:hypothetical protein
VEVIVGDSYKGPLNNHGKPASTRKKQTQTNLNTRTKRTRGPTARQTIGPATLGQNFTPLEGYGTASVQIRLARGSIAPSSGDPSRSRVGRPSSRSPPRSRAGRPPPLARSPVSIESQTPPRASFHLARGHHRPPPAPPAGAFNALTPAGIQVKGESTPLRARESCPATAPPTPVARPSPPLCDAVRHGQQSPRGTVPPTPVRPAHRTLEKGRRNPRRDDARLLRARTRRRRNVRPVEAVTSVAIGPVRSSPSPRRRLLHHHTRRCGTRGDRTPPRRPLCLVRSHVNGTLESPRGRPSNEQPQCHPPRSRS